MPCHLLRIVSRATKELSAVLPLAWLLQAFRHATGKMRQGRALDLHRNDAAEVPRALPGEARPSYPARSTERSSPRQSRTQPGEIARKLRASQGRMRARHRTG